MNSLVKHFKREINGRRRFRFQVNRLKATDQEFQEVSFPYFLISLFPTGRKTVIN